MMWAIDCRLRRRNWNHIDGVTKFMGEPGADGTPGSHHMVHIEITQWHKLTKKKKKKKCQVRRCGSIGHFKKCCLVQVCWFWPFWIFKLAISSMLFFPSVFTYFSIITVLDETWSSHHIQVLVQMSLVIVYYWTLIAFINCQIRTIIYL